jgi:hypothetical protein
LENPRWNLPGFLDIPGRLQFAAAVPAI